MIQDEQLRADEAFMRMALKEAEKAGTNGEIPIGAVIVCGGRIISRAHNLTETLHDVTAHAEMQAITAAANMLGGKYLKGCTLYVTVEPCPMCSGAIVNSRIDTVVYGCPDAKAGGAESIFNIITNPNLNHTATVISGSCEEECAQVMKNFFKRRREENKAKKQQQKQDCCVE